MRKLIIIFKFAVCPELSVTPEKLVVKEGEPARFVCVVTRGSPAPEVSMVFLLLAIF